MVTHKYTLENKVYSTFTVTFGTELTSIVWCFTIGFHYFQNLEIINTRASKIWGRGTQNMFFQEKWCSKAWNSSEIKSLKF